MKNYLVNKLSREIKIDGFKKSGLTWISKSDLFSYVVNIQTSKYTNGKDVEFVIYIGIYSQSIFNLCWDRTITNNIKETDCCLRGHLSVFFNIEKDLFSLKTECDVEENLKIVSKIVDSDILPFFHRINSYNDLYDMMLLFENKVLQKELHQIYIACVEFLLGKKEEALVRLSRISNAVWANKAKEVAERILLS